MSELSTYIKRIPNFTELTRQPSKLVPYFAHYLEFQDANTVIKPSGVDALFDEVRVRRPGNTSDTIRKSQMFVRVRGGGYRLSHEGRSKISSSLEPSEPPDLAKPTAPNNRLPAPTNSPQSHAELLPSSETKRNVMVVYGQDERLRSDLFSLLRAFGLNPLQFTEMAHLTGSASPYLWEIVEAGFRHAQVCVVMFSPDELVELRPDLCIPGSARVVESQPRPNVLLEAGMALALHPTRTILLRIGAIRPISDLIGKHYVNLDGTAESRHKLLNKLKLAQCDVNTQGEDWLSVGSFKLGSI
ncbi:TIR domain-containing protein [Granulicella sp. L46]|uniref:TIR domain-containing protein n=1 Tax=Granulicella sp. L46 TaxID=1641865 RepID=UPI00131D7CBD|nr:TIR domain-containing protein [Granulicella sp. L46]